MHNIHVTNLAAHDQVFEVHGWNGNKNLTVKARTTSLIQAEDGTSGAIIALHEGHEGEQAEITKKGFGVKATFATTLKNTNANQMLLPRQRFH